jgi:VanZ family protein
LRIIFPILSIVYIVAVFLLADSPVVSHLAPFNPYSLLHIPLYAILTVLLIFSFKPHPRVNASTYSRIHPSTHPRIHASTHVRFFLPGAISLIVAIADEIYQSFIPTRDASITDVFLDLIGIALALFLISKYKTVLFFTDGP